MKIAVKKSELERALHRLARVFRKSQQACERNASRTRKDSARLLSRADGGDVVFALLHASYMDGQAEGHAMAAGDLERLLEEHVRVTDKKRQP